MGFWRELGDSIGLNKGETTDTAGQLGGAGRYDWGTRKGSAARAEVDRRKAMEADALVQASQSWGQNLQARDQSQQARGEQQRLMGEYQQMASGQGPSLAREQLRAGMGQAQAQAAQTAASTRGGAANALLASRNAQQQGSQMALQTNQQAAEIRAKEQLAAMDAQAGLAGNMRAGDLSTRAGDLSARGQDLAQANAQMDAQMRVADAAQRGKMAAGQEYAQAVQFDTAQNNAAAEAARQRRQQFAAGIIRGAASGGMSLATG